MIVDRVMQHAFNAPSIEIHAVPLQHKATPYLFWIFIITLSLFFIGLSIVWQRNLVYYQDSKIEHFKQLLKKTDIDNKQLKIEILKLSAFHEIKKAANERLGLEFAPIKQKRFFLDRTGRKKKIWHSR